MYRKSGWESYLNRIQPWTILFLAIVF
jgi:hypothetical protein